MKTVPATQIGVSRGFSALILARTPDVLAWRATMEFRTLGRTDWKISTVSFGAWAIGGTFGTVKDDDSMAALHRALDRGVNFFDTADVYGDGRSERLLARLRKERKEPFYITTKAGRRLPKQTVEGYNKKNITAFVDRSLKNLATDTLDLCRSTARRRTRTTTPRCSSCSTTW